MLLLTLARFPVVDPAARIAGNCNMTLKFCAYIILNIFIKYAYF